MRAAARGGLQRRPDPGRQAERAGTHPRRPVQVDQGHLRAETIGAANGMLIGAQAKVDIVRAWGGGLVASADGVRFTVPVQTIHAGYSSRYFGLRKKGATWLNVVNDQVMGLGGVVVPGTLGDSLFILDALLGRDGGPKPETVVTDTASYSDIVFGLFAICGYQFSPRIADISDARLWRTHASADYGPLQEVSRHTVRLGPHPGALGRHAAGGRLPDPW
ncbi:Tn3 family transposase [Streptomyces griseoruber]|uniref:Tn3 family transposase n=1 Tax=Streptomyces griseoruber TaxID=1943 RepID=UPI0037B7E0E0